MASSVVLGNRLDEVVADLINAGRYNSRSEVIREGIRLVQEREARLAKLNAAIDRGLADGVAGRVHEIDEVMASLEGRWAKSA